MYLLEITRQVSMEQAGMYIALIKVKVKVPGNSSVIITGLSNLIAIAVGIVESANCSKEWDERKI